MIYPTKGRGIYVTEQLHKSFNFDINGEGLYIWTPIKNSKEPTNYDGIEYKIGQYGTNANEGTNPVTTIDNYLGTHNTQALILYAIDLTEYIKSQLDGFPQKQIKEIKKGIIKNISDDMIKTIDEK
jgi:hypothetical protein